MARSRALLLATWFLLAPLGCLETAAVDPWLTDGAAVTDTPADDADVPADVPPATGWRPVQIPIEAGEAITDWWGYVLNDVRTLAFVTDAGHFARMVGGAPVEFGDTSILPGTTTPLAYRAIWTGDGKTFWFAGHGNVLRRGKPSLWNPTDLVPDSAAGNWNDLWGDGSSVLWAVGNDGAYVRLDADGKNPSRLSAELLDDWHSVSGAGARVWVASSTRVVTFSNAVADRAKPFKGQLRAVDISTEQVIERAFAVDDTFLFLAGKPTQLLRLDAADTPAVFGPPLSSGINAFFDVHGMPGGDVLAVGESGTVFGLSGGLPIEVDTANLPTELGLRRVWSFDDGSAYVLNAIGEVYYRAPL